jgi:hypothetical protein
MIISLAVSAYVRVFKRINELLISKKQKKINHMDNCASVTFKKEFNRIFSYMFILLLGGNLLYAQSPTITTFSPAYGSVGTLITITGTNLGSPTSLTIGGVAALSVSNNGTELVTMVMPGSTTGTLIITTGGGTVTSAGNFTVTSTNYPIIQQGNKLVGSGASGASGQGLSVAISADGITAIVGGYNDNTGTGAAWIYTRSGTTWTQQGSKLIGTGATGKAGQGVKVALSADGNTAIVGGYGDNSLTGAVWIYTRSVGVWTQQGNKLVGTGNSGASQQGRSVSLSADGNTALVGGYADNANAGAVWVYTRSGGTWSQQGSKLVGTGATGKAQQGQSACLSADGNTAMVGGIYDNTNIGAVWVFTGSSGTWTQQGSKLIGTGGTTAAYQGGSACLSADGNIAMVGGFGDNSNAGAVWVYTRSGSTWTQQGSKLVGTGGSSIARQGTSLSISADGNTAIVSGYTDNSNTGACWVFTKSSGTWTQRGSKILGTGAIGSAQQGATVSLSADGKFAIEGGFADNSSIGAAWMFTNTPTYYTQASGDPASLSNWNTIRSGGGLNPSNFTDTANFLVQNGHTLTTTGAFSFGATRSFLEIESGGTFTASSGNAITFASGSTLQIEAGGVFNANTNLTTQAINLIGGNFNIGSSTVLTINGVVTSTSGVISGSTTSDLILGTNVGTLLFDQTLPGTSNVIRNLTLGTGAAASMSLGNALNIAATGKVMFNVLGTKSFNTTGQSFTLKSNSSGTAIIFKTNGTAITGNITAENYLPATGRKYRFLASPVVGATSSNWRNNGVNTSGIGIQITGSGSNFDASTSNNSSAFGYAESSAGSSGTVGAGAAIDAGWAAFTDGNSTALTNGKGFRVFVRGDRTLSLTTSPPPSANTTTISVTGTYPSSSVTINTTKTGTNSNSGYNLIGNPFPCTIDWNAITKTNIGGSYFIYNPTTSSYGSWNGSLGTNGVTQYISSGQGFLVLNNSASGSLTISESHKVSSLGGALFKTILSNQLRIAMKFDNSFSDELIVHFREDATEGLDNFDAPKLVNSSVNLAAVGIDNKRYNINCLSPLISNREIALSVMGSVQGTYSFIFNNVSSFEGYDVLLVDNFLHSNTKVSDGAIYQVQITADSSTILDGRFKLVFNKTLNGIQDNIVAQNLIQVYPNPVNNLMNIDLNGNSNATYLLINELGAEMEKGVFNQSKNEMNTSRLSTGVYFLRIFYGNSNQTIKFIK